MDTVLESTLRHLRHAARMARLHAAFSLTVILTLALGIGATTAIFSVVSGVVLKPLHYPDSDNVVRVTHSVVFNNQRVNDFAFSPQMLETYLTHGQAFEHMGVISFGQAAITGIGDAEQARTLGVTAGALAVFAIQPVLGRWFSPDEDRPGAAATVLLSDSYWQRRFGGDEGVIGRMLTIDGTPRAVIGVMPDYLVSGASTDLYLPPQIDLANPPNDYRYTAVARLKPGVTMADANADIGRMLPMFLQKYAGNRMDALQMQPAVRPLKEDVVGNVDQFLWVLLGSISILLVIACANVANLLLVRTETRGTELAVRSALGAGSARLAHGLMAESLMLSVAGGIVGVALAYGGLELLLALTPPNLPRLNEIAIDVPVLLFAAATSILSGLLFGLFPLLKLAGSKFAAHLAESLRGGGRWASAGKKQHRSQNTLVVVQVALALVMLVSAGLMIRTFQNLRSVEPGFTAPETIQTVRLTLSGAMAADRDVAVQRQQQILERLAAIPGVESAAYMDALPMQGGGGIIVFPDNATYGPDELPPTRRIKGISPGLLRTLGMPLLAGRDFEWVELHEQRNVALVSLSFARETWGSAENAMGKRLRVGTDGPWQEVIGVVADIYDSGTSQPPTPIVYWPARAHPAIGQGGYFSPSVAFVLRSDRTGTQSFLQELRRAAAEVTPDLPLTQVQTLADVYDNSMARTSFTLVLLGIAGAMALLLSIVGIYGVLAYAVTQRRREVGIRLALGAEPVAVKKMFVRHGMILSGVGIVLGTIAAVGLTRMLASMLFGVAPIDATTFVGAAAFLAMAALMACYIPARRAAAVAPAETLRRE